MKNKLVILCKTYHNDFNAFKILKKSIDTYNVEKIPFVVICPKSDESMFRAAFSGSEPYDVHFLFDEDLVSKTKFTKGYYTQQLCKMNFYKTKLAEFFVIIDSDSYFIRNFYVSDFMYDDYTPYIVMHEGKDARLINEAVGFSAIYEEETKVQNYFKRKDKHYRFLTTPIVFSSKVLAAMEKKMPFDSYLEMVPVEASWHGEFLLKHNTIPFRQCEPVFKCMVYAGAYDLYRKLGVTTDDIAKDYLGIVMQSKHIKDTVYKDPRGKLFITYLFYKILTALSFGYARNRYKNKAKLIKRKRKDDQNRKK